VAQAEQQHGPRRDVVVAFPGAVYGNGSWFKQYYLDPILAGQPVMRVNGPPRWISPIHVDDCGRAIAHLALDARAPATAEARRAFLVDDEPTTYDALAALTAECAGQPLRIRRLPGVLLSLFAGSVVRSYMETDSKYSNARLRASGFVFTHPSIRSGIPAVVDAMAR
jgi:nucleoside-diphosphate-sugar epimerase